MRVSLPFLLLEVEVDFLAPPSPTAAALGLTGGASSSESSSTEKGFIVLDASEYLLLRDQDYNRRKDMQRETISSEVCKRRCYFGKKLMRCHRDSRDSSHSTATETERKRS